MSTKEKSRIIQVHGVNVDVVTFGERQFYYPQIGDQEFRATAKGFRSMSRFIRTVLWAKQELARTYESLTAASHA